MTKVKVNQNLDNEVPKEILAEAIVKISKAFEDLKKSGLNQKAIIALVHDLSKISKRDIQIVLNTLSILKREYCA